VTPAGRRLVVAAAIAAVALVFPTPIAGPVGAFGGDSATNYRAVCGPAEPGYAQCLALQRTDVGAALGGVVPAVVPSGYGPADLRSAYSIPATGGSGLTVAIVDAYDQPNAESDMAAYRTYYGLPACTTANGCFRKVDQNGGTHYPVADLGWGQEIDLDLQMVSAVCPSCKILLVEANSSLSSDLAASVDRAVAMGAIAVSNSYGGPEPSGALLTGLDAHYNHPGVAITAATGDCGFDCVPLTGTSYTLSVSYPAASRYVVAVGGTSLTRDGSARGWTESVWGDAGDQMGAGAGCAAYAAKPSWQTDPNCTHRMVGDVAAVADPHTGVAVYIGAQGGWWVFGGTSASAPIVAAMYALAGTPAAGTYPASYLYADQLYEGGADFHDVTSGSADIWGPTNTPCLYDYFCDGVVGYDGPTGLGTPNGLGAFHNRTNPGAPTGVTAVAHLRSATVGWSAPASSGGSTITKYTVTASDGVHTCTWSSGPLNCSVGGLSDGTAYTFTVRATTNVGTGAASSASNQITTPGYPGAPTNVVATPYNESALVSWSAAPNGGGTISAYEVTASDGVSTCSTGGTLSCIVGGLTNGDPYAFTVRATNEVGQGPASSASNTVAPDAVPDAPASVHATAAPVSATVTWSAPADNGSPISGYTVTSTPASAGCTADAATLGCQVVGLANGTAYTFSVFATNGTGNGPTGTSNAVTPADKPGAPAVTATPGIGRVGLSWTAPTANGSAITGYTVTSSPASAGCTTGAATRSCTVSGLTNGVWYTFSVKATNGVGTGPAGTARAIPQATLVRYAGADIFASAAAVSANTFASPCHCTAYIAYAYNFPDALAGAAAAAGKVRGPVLFAATNGTLNAATAAELARLSPDRIVVLGSAVVISDAVMSQLAHYAPAGATVRTAGPDRYATAAAVSAATYPANCGCTVYVAYAKNYPDAVAGAAAAGRVPGPVLLVDTRGRINASTLAELKRLKPANIVVLGSTVVISATVYNALAAYAPKGHLTRYYGPDRYATAASISAHTYPASCGCTVYVASGTDYNDALAGAAAAGTVTGPLLLVYPSGSLPSSTVAELKRLKPARIVVVGNTSVVSAATYNLLAAYVPH
jgi:putative cell wall-binding protein